MRLPFVAILLLLLAAAAEARDKGVPVEFGHEVLSSVGPLGDEDVYLYEGAAGAKVSFAVAATDGALQPGLALLAPGGAPVDIAGLLKTSAGKASFALTLPATGRYVLRISGTGGTTGASPRPRPSPARAS